MAFAIIYICPIHDETIDVVEVPIIDPVNGDASCITLCAECSRAVRAKTDEFGNSLHREMEDWEVYLDDEEQ